MFLPDTNVWIRLIKGRNQPLINKWRTVLSADIGVCSVVKGELWLGAHKYEKAAERRQMVDEWLFPYQSFSFDDNAAHHYADIRHDLEVHGQIIGPNDLKIAAICRAHDLTLVTSNTREFCRVPGLRVEDWVQAAEEK